MKPRIVAFVDHEIGYRLLERLIKLSVTWPLQLVAAVTTQENGFMWWPGVADLCRSNKVPLHRYETDQEKILSLTEIDWYFLLSWKHIIGRQFISRPKLGTVNLHYSLLPEYRGVYPVNWAIIEGRKKTGVSYHLVTEEVDAGPIVYQEELPVYQTDTARSLQLRLDDLAFECFDRMLKKIMANPRGPSTQENQTGCQSYKNRQQFSEISQIDLYKSYTGWEIYNLLRGLTFMPDGQNAYIINETTGRKIYISINLVEAKGEK